MKTEHIYIEPRDVAKRHIQALQAAGLNFSGKKILDLGCGTGTYTRLMAEQGAALVIGVDKILGNVKLARQINSASNIKFICADIEDWKIQDQFNFIFLRATIYYLKTDLEEIISNIVVMLAPGGDLFITFMNSNPRAVLINTIKKCAAYVPEVFHPFVRSLFTTIYYCLVSLVDQRKPNWKVIKNKMNTIFFPLKHLIDPSAASRILSGHGLIIAGFFKEQGQNPSLSNEYGIWSVLKNGENVISKSKQSINNTCLFDDK